MGTFCHSYYALFYSIHIRRCRSFSGTWKSLSRFSNSPRKGVDCRTRLSGGAKSGLGSGGVITGEVMEHVTINGSEVVVGDPQSLQSKISSIRIAGPQKLQVIADFDATLTKYWIDGRRGQSSHGLLQQGNPEFDEKRQKLYEYYHPLEFDPTIPLDRKAVLMEEWWGKTHALLIEGGLTYDAIKTSVANANIAFREGVIELFEFLEGKDIPILVFSAGLADIIEEVFRQKLHRSFKNVRIVSNRMEFDKNGQLVAFRGKTIHVLNKNEHALDMAGPVHDRIDNTNGEIEDNSSVKKRTNVLLLGDHIGDLGMSDGLDYETRISLGFLNDNIENSLESYQKAFDVVYLNDASMRGVLKLTSQLCPD
ncbi:OLC1v1026450C1 [Oldenlandia corymbosa var. corymbosa]|uniref:5'-nucleotidase n=1 Tax=Oldenlandia corymbosa var. corymbosa TaxID=529605 RepID=A0AAV1C9T5_OLDCO|nr:OLC1v1026450C1 [Oldenlandia corymbosa var. corymbosa]